MNEYCFQRVQKGEIGLIWITFSEAMQSAVEKTDWTWFYCFVENPETFSYYWKRLWASVKREIKYNLELF